MLALLGSLAVAGLFTVLVLAVWADSEAGGVHCDAAFLGGDERTSPDVQLQGWNWWPPGLKCTVTPRGGQHRTEVAPLW